MESNWPEFYANRLGRSYLYYCKERYKPFIDAIWNNTRREANVIEFGCGTGTITQCLLERAGRQHHLLIDKDATMLDMAKFRLREHGTKNIGWLQADIRELISIVSYKSDMIHSHGVLEHYSDFDIVRIVNVCLAVAPIQVHYVPGLYPSPSYGDERLLPVEYWQHLLPSAEITTFNDGLDYCIVVKNASAV